MRLEKVYDVVVSSPKMLLSLTVHSNHNIKNEYTIQVIPFINSLPLVPRELLSTKQNA